MHFTCRSFSGSHNQTNWSQYWENEPDDSVLSSSKGHLFGLININIDSDSQDVKNIGHDIIFEINQTYFSSVENRHVGSLLEKTLLSVVNNPLFNFSDITIIIAVVINNKLYSCIFGNGKIIINRQNQVSVILSGDTAQTKTISGPLQPEDKILLSTQDFYQQISWEKIKEILSDDNVQNIEENFLSSLYSQKEQSNLAAAFIQIHTDLPVETLAQEGLSSSQSQPSVQSPKTSKPIISFFKRLLKPKPIVVSHQQTTQTSKRKKINIIIALILLLCLAASSYFGYKKNRASQMETQYQSFKTELDKKFTDIAAVKNLNLDSALSLARESQTIVQKMSALNLHSQELSQYQNQIKSLLSQTGSSDSFSPESFYDTSLIFDNPKYSKITLNNDLLYLLDPINGRIDSVDINQKSTKNISISDKIKSSNNIAQNNDSLFISNNTDLFLVTKNGPESKLVASSTDFNFWNGALYILDNQNSTIWKFSPNSTGFSPAQIWLQDSQKLNPNPVSLTINGEIWVLSKDGKINPYSRGTKQDFKPTQTAQITNASNLVTAPDSNILAFADNENLIYVYKKTGEVMAKYNLGNLKIADLALHDKSNSLFILCTDQKIYKISL